MSVLTFKDFAIAIQRGDTVTAGIILTELLEVSQAIGETAASYFNSKLMFEPDLFSDAMQIRKEILAGKDIPALMLIHKCLSLSGLEGIQALEAMRKLA
ncbi:MAG TPA: hypothetical protein EYQ64_02585 [Gemmatimonadetes bacterium]|nr:hypothetical protein [Gemmatimonadota bacterium]